MFDVLEKAHQISVVLVVTILVSVVVTAVIFFVIDVTQSQHAIRRNYPVIGRFRYLFEYMGEFFRQYFFAMDREELPFNRSQRSWAYRAAKNISNTKAFGSSGDITKTGTVLFVSCPYPTMSEDAASPEALTIGEGCRIPFHSQSLFNISAMSYGALSRSAVRALGKGAKLSGCWLNTGEGGLSPYHIESGCDLVFQIGTAKYGVRDPVSGELDDSKLREIASYTQVRMFEIKLSQGGKPGKGGILPADKVSAEVAAIRCIPEGKDSISPNRHRDIACDEDLLNMIERVRQITGKPVGFKSVISSERWLDQLFSLICERGVESAPDFITVDGCDGGTGAAPQPLLDDVGLPLKESLPMLIDKLTEYGLRDRVRVIASGKLINPSYVAWALCMGADFVNSARGFMFALGCIQALQCNKNSCPTGITTHVTRLERGLNPELKSHRVAHYVENMLYEVGMIAHSCGARHCRDLTREHARIVQRNGLSKPLNELHPLPFPSKAKERRNFSTRPWSAEQMPVQSIAEASDETAVGQQSEKHVGKSS